MNNPPDFVAEEYYATWNMFVKWAEFNNISLENKQDFFIYWDCFLTATKITALALRLY